MNKPPTDTLRNSTVPTRSEMPKTRSRTKHVTTGTRFGTALINATRIERNTIAIITSTSRNAVTNPRSTS